jgi:restriction endonuclease S subunit
MTTVATARPRAFSVNWKNFERWDVKFFKTQIKSSYPIVKLASYITEHVERKLLYDFPEASFKILGVTNSGGIFHAYDCLGEEINQPYKQVDSGDLAYNPYRVNVGSIGVVPPELGGNYISPAYVVFAADSSRLLSEYLFLILKSEWYNPILRAATAGSVRQNLTFELLGTLEIPFPPLQVQQAIVHYWKTIQKTITDAEYKLGHLKQRVNDYLHSLTIMEPCERRALTLSWDKLESWDVKSSRAAAFKLANPAFKPLSEYAEEATELARPKLEPEKDWPVYGVNNKEGVFFSDYQKGADFNASYKRIRKDWFFHNPTRSSVGSLGIVPEVPEDAITSPEYQVWRIHNGLQTGFAAVMITTEYFIKLIQFNRVGAVKQRLYVENLLSIPIPEIPEEFQREVADEREKALASIAEARAKVATAAIEVEAMILGTKKIED